MSKDKREAERAARRARRLAERAEERAKRKERHAERASERAERLAERVRRRPSREKELDQSIEDLVDEVTEKAEAWIDEQTKKLFESSASDDRQVKKAESQARKARQEAERARANANRAESAADELSDLQASMDEDFGEYYDDDMGDGYSDSYDDYGDDEYSSPRKRRKSKRKSRRRRYGYSSWHGLDWGDWGYDEMGMPRRRRRRTRSANLYRDRQNSKICGVCAGLADYFGRPTWEMRLYAVLGMVFIPSVTFPAYFILYFLMDDKPYYRRVTDRFEEKVDRQRQSVDDVVGAEEESVSRSRRAKQEPPKVNNVQAMKEAKSKFADIEQRLRQMETHVTSSRFELQRELKKISGED